MEDVFIARQPIFGRGRAVRAYELLYRSYASGPNGRFDDDQATSRVLANACLTIGIDSLTNGRRAYVNFPRDGLLAEYATLVPADRLVVEVLESVRPEPEVVAALRHLKELGYRLALDDVIGVEAHWQPFYELADVVKIDFLGAPRAFRAQAVKLAERHEFQLLAEKVETEEEFVKAAKLGYTRFQGYFFAKPQIVAGRRVPASKLNHLRLMREMHKSEISIDSLEAIIRGELSLTYKLLKLLNSPAFGFRRRITNLRLALVAVGERELRKWVSLVCLSELADDKPQELVVSSMIRALFCESLALLLGQKSYATDLYFVGLFSMLDALMDRPLSECLDELAVSPEARAALVDGSGLQGAVLRVAQAYEAGDWSQVSGLAAVLDLDYDRVAGAFVAAMHRADILFAGT